VKKRHDLIAEKVVLMFSVYCLLVIELYDDDDDDDDDDECLQSDNDETFRNNRGGISNVKRMKLRLSRESVALIKKYCHVGIFTCDGLWMLAFSVKGQEADFLVSCNLIGGNRRPLNLWP